MSQPEPAVADAEGGFATLAFPNDVPWLKVTGHHVVPMHPASLTYP